MANAKKWRVPPKRAEDLERANAGITFIRPSKLAEEGKEGVILEGTFIESMPNPFDNEKLDFKFIDSENKTVIINGGGNLSYQMSTINPGSNVQISYNGKKEMKKGKYEGRSAHNFEVLEEDTE